MIEMTYLSGYLTPRESLIWGLKRRLDSVTKISTELGISRQAVYKSLNIIETKIEQAFNEALDSNKLEPILVNLAEGVMKAYSPAHDLPVIVSLSEANGLKLWYLYKGNCSKCKLELSCQRMLVKEAKERGVQLTNRDLEGEPTDLALRVFSPYFKEGE